MKISVITVCFNSAKSIADTLRSVDAQLSGGHELEHLIIDGGSIDQTLDIVRAHARAWRRVVSEPDKGIYDAMNKGLRLATGDFVGFLNGDDMFADRNVVSDIAQAASSPSIDAVYGDLIYVRKDRPEKQVRYWRGGSFSPSSLRFGWMPPHPTLYVRRSRTSELGLFDAEYRIAADYEFVLRYFSQPAFGVAYIPKVLVWMRIGGASNRSVTALMVKSREDLRALQKNKVGGILTLFLKNARKMSQFLSSPRLPVG
jgi:glycosyltransferase